MNSTHFTVHAHPDDLALADLRQGNEIIQDFRMSLEIVEALGHYISVTPCENECYPRGMLVIEDADTHEPIIAIRIDEDADEIVLLQALEVPSLSMN